MGNRFNAPNNDINQPPDQLIEVNPQGEENDNRIKPIITVKNPFYLIKETISLEKDSIKNIYYIKFKYDSLINFNCYINFNVKKNKKRKHLKQKEKYELCFTSSPEFVDKQIIINNLEKGKNKEFFYKEAFLDLDYYEQKQKDKEIKNKNNDEEEIYDIGIEFTPIYDIASNENESNEIIFVSLFKIEKKEDELDIKCISQKLKKHKFWFELKDIFDGAGTNGKCIICYANYRNTIFLPCRHSSCCQKCSGTLSPKDCPLCKNHIQDIICLDSDRSIDNKSFIEDNQNINEDNQNINEDNQNINEDNQNINEDNQIINEDNIIIQEDMPEEIIVKDNN